MRNVCERSVGHLVLSVASVMALLVTSGCLQPGGISLITREGNRSSSLQIGRTSCGAPAGRSVLLDDYQHFPGGFTSSNAITVDRGGTVFAPDQAVTPGGATAWVLRKFNGTWTTHPISFKIADGTDPGLASVASGELLIFSTDTIQMNVHRSVDGGASWSLVDTFVPPGAGSNIQRIRAQAQTQGG